MQYADPPAAVSQCHANGPPHFGCSLGFVRTNFRSFLARRSVSTSSSLSSTIALIGAARSRTEELSCDFLRSSCDSTDPQNLIKNQKLFCKHLPILPLST